MKKLYLILLAFIIVSCRNNNEHTSEIGKMLEGEHALRKFNVVDEKGYRTHTSYFLLSGSSSGETYNETKVSFSFQLPDSSYGLSELHYSNIRVKIDSTIEEPFVTFCWSSGNTDYNMDYVMKYHVNYMVVHCKEDDFPYDVNIDGLK